MSHWCVSRRHAEMSGLPPASSSLQLSTQITPSKMMMLKGLLACVSPRLPPRLGTAVAALGGGRPVRLVEQDELAVVGPDHDLGRVVLLPVLFP
jgi:hypothetical protein